MKSAYEPRRGTPLGDAYHRAVADMEDPDVMPDVISWLKENPFLWLRALLLYRDTVRNRSAMARDSLAHHKPEIDTTPSPEYLKRKWQVDRANQFRQHLEQRVNARIEEVKSLIGAERVVDWMSVGDLIATAIRIREAARRDDFDAVDRTAGNLIDKLTARRKEHR